MLYFNIPNKLILVSIYATKITLFKTQRPQDMNVISLNKKIDFYMFSSAQSYDQLINSPSTQLYSDSTLILCEGSGF